MSAFFVAPATIDAAVAAFIAKDGPLSLEAATELGRALWALNVEAVRWLYDLDTRSDEDRQDHASNLAEVAAYTWTPRALSLPVTVKSLDCLHYQCCEGPVRETALYGRLTALANHHDASGVRDSEAYARAPWGLDEPGPEEVPSFPPEEAPEVHTELTPEGEQFVIPGCERNRSSLLRQFDLFG